MIQSKYYIRIIGLCGIYIAGIIVSLLICRKITLPFYNPWHITGLLPQLKYNPATNIVKFIIIIAFPSVALVMTSCLGGDVLREKIYDHANNRSRVDNPDYSLRILDIKKRYFFFFFSILFAIIIAINIPTFHSSGEFDSFHEGESLGTAVSYMQGKVPYKDIIFIHGIFQDPLRSIIAFKLLGKSIGSARTLESFVKVLSFVFLFVLLLKLFSQNYLYAYISFLILAFLSICDVSYWRIPNFLIVPPRDILTFMFLIVFQSLIAFLIQQEQTFPRFRTYAGIFLFSFLPLASFSYSVDRGLYLFATYLLFAPALFLFAVKKGIGRYCFMISLLGLIVATLLMGFLLKWEYSEFYKFVFLAMPKYKELMTGMVYPIHHITFLLPVALIGLNVFLITYFFLRELLEEGRKIDSLLSYLKNHLMEICLLVMSVFFFRSALGRSDWEHVVSSSIMSYILFIYLVIRHYLNNFLSNRNVFRRNLTYLISLCVFLVMVLSACRAYNKNLITENFPFQIDDSHFIPGSYKNTIFFIKDNLGERETFFTMTSEASWYYFINRPCPTRFPIVYFAAPPFFQGEIVNDLKIKEVKYILYQNKDWASSMDGFTNEKRLPIIAKYIKENYSFSKNIDGNELWIKKHGSSPN